MSLSIQTAYYISWFGQPVLQTLVVASLIKRGLRRAFPKFLALNAFEAVAGILVIIASLKENYAVYFYVTWAFVTLDLAFMFIVIYEVFQDVFRPYHTLKDLGAVVFKWAALVMVIVSAVVAAASSNSPLGPAMQSILTAQRCIRLMQLGLVLFLIVFSKYLGSSWKSQSFGVAFGFGSYALVELIVVSLHASLSVSQRTMNLTFMSAYDITILVWLGYVWFGKPIRQTQVQFASQRWEQSLTDIRHPVPADSLIPMFESMVEQAFAHGRKNDERSFIEALTSTSADVPPATLPSPHRAPGD